MTQLPSAFIETTRRLMGDERFGLYLKSFEADTPVSIRLNPSKPVPRSSSSGSLSSPVPWCEHGFYLPRRPNFTFDPLFHAGCYYVQEAASMFIHHVLSSLISPRSPLPAPLQVLDLCAAPGGKSTCAVSALPPGTMLWSNEPVRQRASILNENIQKWGYAGCTVTNSYPHDYVRAGLTFDVILCDVPCSGEGMFRRDPQTIAEWSPLSVEKCVALQRDIVCDAWQCLRPGGLLIYSTCTFNTMENEQNVSWMLQQFADAQLLAVPTQPEWNITGSLLAGFGGPVYRFIPGITRSEGLFVAVLRKGAGQSLVPGRRKERKDSRQVLKTLFTSAPALSSDPPCVAVGYAAAVSYLRGEAIVLPPDVPRGLVTVTFQGYPLGQAKNVGSRANNLYPKEWRIKSTHVPAVYEPVLPL